MRNLTILSFFIVSLISFQAHAESTFITWPKTIDEKFRVAYKAKTGEAIQENPLESADGLSYMIGTWRATDQQVSDLKADTDISTENEIKSRKGIHPDTWEGKVTAEP